MRVICWFSGGVTSAIACKISIDLYGLHNCRFIFIDTKNEDADTYRFLEDCENWYGAKIERMSNNKYNNIDEVWEKFGGMNFAHGAICSAELKRNVRIKFEKENEYKYQVFGFDIDEPKRAKSMAMNYPKSKPIFPLLFEGLSKKDCIERLTEAGIDPPQAYKDGFQNNNCLNTGCVQGGIWYWQKIEKDYPDRFNAMAKREHYFTDKKGQPVTLLRDQSNEAKKQDVRNLFLLPHPNYSELKDISMFKGVQPKPLMECNGFCATDDLFSQIN